MTGRWRTAWATGPDLPRLDGLVRTGPVIALSSGGDDRRPLVAVVTGRDQRDEAGDRLQVWDVAAGAVTAAETVDAWCVASSGTTVVTGHADGVVRLWTAPDPAALSAWHTGSPGVDDVRVAGAGEDAVLVTLGADGVVTRWALGTGEPLGVLGGTGCHAIDVRQDLIVTAGDGLALWDAQSGERLPFRTGPETPADVTAVLSAERDGRDVLTAMTAAREFVMVDVATGAPVGDRLDAHLDDLPPYSGRVWGGRRGRPKPAMVGGTLAVPTRWRVHLWDLPAGKPAGPPLPASVRRPVLASLRWAGRDRLLTGSAEDGTVGLWDLDPGPAPASGQPEPISRLEATATGIVVTVDEGGTIVARRAGDGSPVAEATRTGVRDVVALAAWTDGPAVHAATGAGSRRASHPWLQRWDLSARAEMPPPIRVSVPRLRHVSTAVVGGEDVLVVIDRGLLQVRRAADGELLDEVRTHRQTYRLVAGGPRAVVSAFEHPPEVVRLDDLSAPPVPIAGLHGGFVGALDGTHLVAGRLAEVDSGGWHTVWACDLTGEPLGPDVFGPPVTAVAIAGWPAVYIARADGTVSLTDLASGRDLCVPLQLPAEARDIAATADGELVVGVGTDVARFRPPVR